jgi:hypothetical protein
VWMSGIDVSMGVVRDSCGITSDWWGFLLANHAGIFVRGHGRKLDGGGVYRTLLIGHSRMKSTITVASL